MSPTEAAPALTPIPVASTAQEHVPVAVAPVVAADAVTAGADSTWSFAAQPEVSAPRRMIGRRTPWWLRITLSMLGLAALVGAGFGVRWIATQSSHKKESDRADDTKPGDDSADSGTYFSFSSDRSGWEKDETVQKRMGVRRALSRDGVNFFALDHEKYERQVPGKPILIDRAIGKVRKQLSNVAWEPMRPATLEGLEELGTLGGRPALILRFLGSSDAVAYEGRIHLIQHQGIAYWTFAWAPRAFLDQSGPEWDALRGDFSLKDARKGWVAQSGRTKAMRGSSEAYKFAAALDVWEKVTNLEKYHPDTDLVLQGHDPADRRTNQQFAGKMGTVHVLQTRGRKDTLDAAAAFAKQQLTEHFESEGLPNVALSVVDDDEGVARDVRASLAKPDAGPVKFVKWKRMVDRDKGGVTFAAPDLQGMAKITDLHVTHFRAKIETGTYDDFFMVIVVNLKETTLVIRGNCTWKRRDYWTPEFYALLRSFQPL